jgi:hypothetical protein
MVEDERCCGTGTCLINAEGFCWCGQQWDGQTMCRPGVGSEPTPPPNEVAPGAPPPPTD